MIPNELQQLLDAKWPSTLQMDKEIIVKSPIELQPNLISEDVGII